jgi:hypothetical protein
LLPPVGVICTGTVPVLGTPFGLVTVTGGLLPSVAPVPVQLVVPPAGMVCGLGVHPGMLTVSPGVPPVQVTVTLCVPVAGFGVAVQVGITGAVKVPAAGDPPMLVDPIWAVIAYVPAVRLVTVKLQTPLAFVVQLAADTVEPLTEPRLKLAPGTSVLLASRAVTVQLILLPAIVVDGVQLSVD